MNSNDGEEKKMKIYILREKRETIKTKNCGEQVEFFLSEARDVLGRKSTPATHIFDIDLREATNMLEGLESIQKHSCAQDFFPTLYSFVSFVGQLCLSVTESRGN